MDDTLPQPEVKKKLLADYPKARRSLIGILVLATISLASWYYTRPTAKAKVDRILADAGLGKIPVLVTECRIAVKDDTSYVRFCANQDRIEDFVEQSSSLRNESFEVLDSGHLHRHSPPWFPDWFEPATIEKGRWYGFDSKKLRVEVFIDSDSNSVYIKVFSVRIPWLQRLWKPVGWASAHAVHFTSIQKSAPTCASGIRAIRDRAHFPLSQESESIYASGICAKSGKLVP